MVGVPARYSDVRVRRRAGENKYKGLGESASISNPLMKESIYSLCVGPRFPILGWIIGGPKLKNCQDPM